MQEHTANIIINASPEKVFDALTKPELIKRWQFGRDLLTDWKKGSTIKFRFEWEGKLLEQWGRVLDVRQNELIRYNLFTPKEGLEDKPENYSTTTYLLRPGKGETYVEIIQEDPTPLAIQVNSIQPVLVALKKVAEEK
jgi:uncharacterized protein YndB with AHSA1/START domain